MRQFFLIMILLLGAAGVQAQDTTIDPAPQFATNETIISVAVTRLNVRALPTVESAIVTVIELGEKYPVIAGLEDGSWWLIAVKGTTGWVTNNLVLVTNPQAIPRTTSAAAAGAVDDATAMALNAQAANYARATLGVSDNLNIRSGPGTGFNIIGRVPFDERATVIGRSEYGNWWQVSYNGVTGWVSSWFVIPPLDVDP